LSDGIDPAIWATAATLVSVLVSTIVTLYIVKWVEPKKWISRYGIRSLEKALEVHGWLLSVLRACVEKARRQEGTEKAGPHLLESSDIWTLETIFGKRAYLLSDRLNQTWYDLQRKDAYFEMTRVKHREPIDLPGASPMIHEMVGADLTEMQKQVEADFAALRSRYEKMTGLKTLQ
jgi:hypothetical protein